jgi:LPXTG-motif cell wall-anchored protein
MEPTRPLVGLLSVALLIIGLVTLLPDCASACSCGGGAPFQVLAKGPDSTAVFSGEVLDVEEGPPTRMFGGMRLPSSKVSLRVSEVWEGPQRETLEVSTPIDGAACGYPFKKGQEYLVYAYGKEEPFTVDLCSQTKLLSKANANLQVLGAGQRPGDEPLPDTGGTSLALPVVLGMLVCGGIALALVRRRVS